MPISLIGQTEQNAHSAREFPADRRLLGSLRKCGTGKSQTAITNSASMLEPGLIRVYAEICHLTRICPERSDYQGNGAKLELPELMSGQWQKFGSIFKAQNSAAIVQ